MTVYCPPALFSEDDAAAYLGVSKTKLRDENIPRRIWGGRKLYLRDDLDDFARSLPYEGDSDDGNVDHCKENDRIFGLS